MTDPDRIAQEKEMVKEDEIDLIDLAKTLWRDRKTIVKTVIIFTILGLFVALFSEKEYTASTLMVPQINNQSSKLGGLSSLASLAGFDMDMSGEADAISPILYPKIISSANFKLEVMNGEYLVEEMEKPISLSDYYLNVYKPGLFGILKKYTLGLPKLILSSIKGNQIDEGSPSKSEIIKLTKDQYEVGKIIEEKLSLEVSDKEGYLTLVSRSPQAFLSAQIAQKSQKLLQKYVTQFRVEKATAQLEFIKERYEENKNEFEEAQRKLAAFRDANKNISSELMRTQEERLQNEYQLAFEVYLELAKQREQSLIKVEENTPVFSVIEEVVVPIERSKPIRSMILFVWIFLGGVIGIGWVMGRRFFALVKRRWKNIEESRS